MEAVRLYRRQERLALVRFFVLTGAVYLLICGTQLAAAWWLIPHPRLPRPVGMRPVLAILIALVMKAYGTWPRRQARHRQAGKIS